jgi:hypothetical protein
VPPCPQTGAQYPATVERSCRDQILGAAPNLNHNFIPLWIAIVVSFGWASAQLARLRAEFDQHMIQQLAVGP